MIPPKTFLGKIALVTGASKGIGRATSLELAKKGADVIVHYYNDPEQAQSVCKEIQKIGSKAYLVKANLIEEKERVQLKAAVEKITKKVDILVNNAGYFDDTDGPSVSAESMHNILALHTTATVRLCALLKPLFTKQASIINVASIHSVVGRPHAVAYSASKAAVHSVTQSLAQAYAPIRINTVSPGPIDTDMWAGDDKKTKDIVAGKTLLKRFGTPEEVANVVVFLASEDASYVTGANIVVDGGALLQ